MWLFGICLSSFGNKSFVFFILFVLVSHYGMKSQVLYRKLHYLLGKNTFTINVWEFGFQLLWKVFRVLDWPIWNRIIYVNELNELQGIITTLLQILPWTGIRVLYFLSGRFDKPFSSLLSKHQPLSFSLTVVFLSIL